MASSRSFGRRQHGDAGSALIEFFFLAVLLLIPLVYVLLTVFEVQRAAYAANAATREAGRAFATAGSDAEGYPRAYAAAAVALADHSLNLGPGQPTIDCSPQPCLTPGGQIDVRLDTEVALPLLPRVLTGRAPATIGIHARHVAHVDEFRGASR
jgi:Flp pilus assembly protein TadG